MNWETLMCLGDSITIGARSYNGYPEVAGSVLAKKTDKYWDVVNHAVSGYTTVDLSRHMTKHWDMLKTYDPSLVTVMISTNDVKKSTNPEDWLVAYELVITKAKLLCPRVWLCAIPKFPVGVMYPYVIAMNAHVDSTNAMIEHLAAKHNCRFVEFQFAEEDFYDGVHLNNSGANKVGRQLAQMILEDRGL